MVSRFTSACMTAFFLSSFPAFAREQPDPREIQARKDCLTGKADAGVALLAELFTETGNATFLYNQARCYEQSTRLADAISRFREYLRVAKRLSAEDKAEVDRHIAECRALLAEQERQAASPPRPTPPLTPALDLTTKPKSAETASQPPFYKTWWFWTGAAAVVVAGTMTAILLAHRSDSPCDGASLACRTVK